MLKKIIIDSQLYVALMGTLLATFFMLEEGSFRFPTFFLIFVTYFNGYIYTKYQGVSFFNKILIINSIIALISISLIFHNHNAHRFYKWMTISFLGLLYNSQFLSTTIRKIPLLKGLYVGIVWGLVNGWLSFHYFSFSIFLMTLLFITALILPFDIRDVETDSIITFPQLIGIKKTKYLAYGMLILAAGLSIIYLEEQYAIAFILTCFISMMFVFFTEKNNSDLYFSFGVETCSCLPFVIWSIFLK
ncbi:hypothetical protein [Flectobacillus longus]|uniref:hypothetical protein n=1 Tax=Flectobacillus longus TaxID=2984207 RepID=UPI0024B6FBD2|nr:hypothetical protein [Flectobacillus longus]MDI9880509.1 hypothetical protein [Flectobacillus longus]